MRPRLELPCLPDRHDGLPHGNYSAIRCGPQIPIRSRRLSRGHWDNLRPLYVWLALPFRMDSGSNLQDQEQEIQDPILPKVWQVLLARHPRTDSSLFHRSTLVFKNLSVGDIDRRRALGDLGSSQSGICVAGDRAGFVGMAVYDEGEHSCHFPRPLRVHEPAVLSYTLPIGGNLLSVQQNQLHEARGYGKMCGLRYVRRSMSCGDQRG